MLPWLKGCRYLYGIELQTGRENACKGISVSSVTVKTSSNLVALVFCSVMKSECFISLKLVLD